MAEHTTQDTAITHATPPEAPRQRATAANTVEKAPVVERASTERSSDVDRKEHVQEDQIIRDEELAVERKEERRHTYARYRPFILGALGLLILAWWISSIILKATRHRWQVPSFAYINFSNSRDFITGSYRPCSLGFSYCEWHFLICH